MENVRDVIECLNDHFDDTELTVFPSNGPWTSAILKVYADLGEGGRICIADVFADAEKNTISYAEHFTPDSYGKRYPLSKHLIEKIEDIEL